MRRENGRELRIFYTILSLSAFPPPCSFSMVQQWPAWAVKQLRAQSLPKLLLVCSLHCSCLLPFPPLSLPKGSSLALPAVLPPNIQVFLAQHKTTTQISLEEIHLDWRRSCCCLCCSDFVGSSESISLPTETHQALLLDKLVLHSHTYKGKFLVSFS